MVSSCHREAELQHCQTYKSIAHLEKGESTMSQDPGSNPYDSPQNAGGGADPPVDPNAVQRVAGPAIGLMVIAGLAIALWILMILFNLLGVGLGAAGAAGGDEQAPGQMLSGTLGLITGILGLGIYGFVFYGASRMKNLQNYGMAMAASIVAMLPCSYCCLAGLPIGIWALIVITKPEIKSAFRG